VDRLLSSPNVNSFINKEFIFKSRKVSPLHFALLIGANDIVNLLLNKGADVNMKDSDGYTPLHYAAMHPTPEVYNLLLRSGADPSAKDNRGITPLQIVQGEHPQDEAWKQIRDSSVASPMSMSPSSIPSAVPSVSPTQDEGNLSSSLGPDPSLSMAPVPVSSPPSSPQPPSLSSQAPSSEHPHIDIANAIMADDINRVKFLLADEVNRRFIGLQLTWAPDEGEKIHAVNVAHLAVLAGNIDILNLVLDAKANLRQQDVDGNTPLHYAVMLGNQEMYDLLIKKGADPNVKNKGGKTPGDLLKQNSPDRESVSAPSSSLPIEGHPVRQTSQTFTPSFSASSTPKGTLRSLISPVADTASRVVNKVTGRGHKKY
jgi:hypothetical protein